MPRLTNASRKQSGLIGDTERRHPVYKLVPLVRHLELAGVPASIVLRDAGLATAAPDDPYALFSQRQMIAAAEHVLRLASPLNCALALGLAQRLGDFGLCGYGLNTGASIRDGIYFAQHYQALATPATEVRLIETDDEACWFVGIVAELPKNSPLQQFLVAYQSGLLVALHRHLSGPDFALRAASFAFRPPDDAGRYRGLLGCPVEFNARQTCLSFERSWLDRAPLGAHALAFRLIEDACHDRLGRVEITRGIIGAIQCILLNQPERPATLEDMAAKLGLHPRTLRRRIGDEGSSYRDIVDRVRFRLATRYLAHAGMTDEAISEKLGFSDASSFRRAFRRWAQRSPNDFRRAGA